MPDLISDIPTARAITIPPDGTLPPGWWARHPVTGWWHRLGAKAGVECWRWPAPVSDGWTLAYVGEWESSGVE